MSGFLPNNSSRQPIYGEQIHRKVGYVENERGNIYFQDLSGKRIARVLRYKPHQAPRASGSLGHGGWLPQVWE